MLSLSIKHVQYVKIYLPCNLEVNLITHLGVIALFSSPIHYVQNHLSKAKWKSLITSAIYKYWSDRINEEIKYYSTLKYLSPTYEIGKIHPLAKSNTVNQKDINRIPTRLKLATGNYMLQTMRAAYNQNPIDPTCKLCNQAEETVSHFLICNITITLSMQFICNP
jgi:hypothetical protein